MHSSAVFSKENCTYWTFESYAVICQVYTLSSAGVSLILPTLFLFAIKEEKKPY